MSAIPPTPHRSNPFSTRYVRPGVIPFQFPAGDSLQSLIDRLAANDWQGSIVGPHGSGKSTLLRSLLVPELERLGRPAQLITLHDGQRSLPARWQTKHEIPANAVIVVDGYEQLGSWQRFKLKRLCQQRQWGLLVTCHEPVGLPVLLETRPTPELLQALAERLTAGSVTTLTQTDISQAFLAAGGNLREALFDLYDRHDRALALNQSASQSVK